MTLLDHLVIAPVVIPAIIAPLTLMVMRRRRHVGVALSLAGCVAMLVVALALFGIAQDDAIRAYPLGGWPAPFGIVLVLLLEIGLITPPVGMNLFTIQAIRPGTALGDVARGALPFVFLLILGLCLLVAFPQIALWLPSKMF